MTQRYQRALQHVTITFKFYQLKVVKQRLRCFFLGTTTCNDHFQSLLGEGGQTAPTTHQLRLLTIFQGDHFVGQTAPTKLPLR